MPKKSPTQIHDFRFRDGSNIGEFFDELSDVLEEITHQYTNEERDDDARKILRLRAKLQVVSTKVWGETIEA